MGALFGLLSAVGIGVSDIFGRRVTATTSAVTAAAMIQLVATITSLVAVVVVPSEFSSRDLALGAVSGIGMGTGLAAYYSGMVRSSATAVTPVVATLAAVIPYVYAVTTGAEVSGLAVVSALIALGGLLVITLAGGGFSVRFPRVRRRGLTATDARLPSPGHPVATPTSMLPGLAWAVFSGCGYGIGLSVVISAGDDSGSWPSFSQRAVAFFLMLVVAHRIGVPKLPPAGVRFYAAAGGVLAGLTTVSYLIGLTFDATAAVVTSSMFPAFSVLVGKLSFGDTVNRGQILGITVVLLGIIGVAVG